MLWRTKHDRDAFKEVWLLFENADGRFPLYPGERITIEYAYSVGEEKWGQWFQRAVRLPTRRLAVRLDFPPGLDPQVWGVETSLSSEEAPLRTPVVREVDADRVRFEWSTDAPPLNARYRLEWRFRIAARCRRRGLRCPANGCATRASSNVESDGAHPTGCAVHVPGRRGDRP